MYASILYSILLLYSKVVYESILLIWSVHLHLLICLHPTYMKYFIHPTYMKCFLHPTYMKCTLHPTYMKCFIHPTYKKCFLHPTYMKCTPPSYLYEVYPSILPTWSVRLHFVGKKILDKKFIKHILRHQKYSSRVFEIVKRPVVIFCQAYIIYIYIYIYVWWSILKSSESQCFSFYEIPRGEYSRR